MSAIAAIISFDGAPADAHLIETMTDCQAHRGGDGVRRWLGDSVALGHVMLQTTTESLFETQPLANEDESVILVMDGRIDNCDELRRELLAQRVRLRTVSDAELVLRAYEAWGRQCVSHIDGDFAFVIWDARRREAFCARDRFGLTPFVYHWSGATLTIASELGAILQMPWVPQTVNQGMLAEIVSDTWLTRDETLWSGIMRLPPAHAMVVTSRGLELSEYWKPDLSKRFSYKSDADYIAHYRTLLVETVRRQSRSHRDVACEVSGGLDSSAIFSVADSLDRSGRLPAPGLSGYTLDFAADEAANELHYAHAVGAHLGRTIREVAPARKSVAWYESQARRHRDFPGYPNGVMHTGIYDVAAAAGARALLTGLGGDHLLSGSKAYYAEELAAARFGRLFDCFTADRRASGLISASHDLVRHGLMPLAPKPIRDALRPLLRRGHRQGAYWLSPAAAQALAERASRATPICTDVRTRGQRQLLQNLYYPFDNWGRELAGRSAAQCGLQIRHPFYATALVDFAFAMPERLRLRGSQTKYIHVQALANLLPEDVRQRRTKACFSGIVGESIRPVVATLASTAASSDALTDRGGIARLIDNYVQKPADGFESWALWGMVGVHAFYNAGLGNDHD